VNVNKVAIKILQDSVVIQTVLGGITVGLSSSCKFPIVYTANIVRVGWHLAVEDRVAQKGKWWLHWVWLRSLVSGSIRVMLLHYYHV